MSVLISGNVEGVTIVSGAEGLFMVDNKDGSKVIIDGQPIPRRCCANCRHTDSNWCLVHSVEVDFRDNGCERWEADQ